MDSQAKRWFRIGCAVVPLVATLGLFVWMSGGMSFGAPEPGLAQLTHYDYMSFAPDWSPDGQHIVFASQHDDPNPDTYSDHNQELFIIDADGSHVKRITYSPRDEADPAWSPDGQMIAFVSGPRLCVMRADSSSLNCRPTGGGHPDWAPDSRRLAYEADSRIHIIEVREGVLSASPVSIGAGTNPVWSPDGQRIAFARDRIDLDTQNIYTMKADGSDVIQVTTGSYPFDWSPDGRALFFVRHVGGDSHIFAISIANGVETQLTDNRHYHTEPALSPDGRRIVFHSLRSEGYNIYVMDVPPSLALEK